MNGRPRRRPGRDVRVALAASLLAIASGCDDDGPTAADGPFEVTALVVEHEREAVTAPLNFRFPDDPGFTLQVFGVDADGDRMNIASLAELPTSVLIGVQDRDVVDFERALGEPPGVLGYAFTIETAGVTNVFFTFQTDPEELPIAVSVDVEVVASQP